MLLSSLGQLRDDLSARTNIADHLQRYTHRATAILPHEVDLVIDSLHKTDQRFYDNWINKTQKDTQQRLDAVKAAAVAHGISDDDWVAL